MNKFNTNNFIVDKVLTAKAIKTKCDICGFDNSSKGFVDVCPMCNANLVAINTKFIDTNLMKDDAVIGKFTGKPITVDFLQKILNEYFDIPNDTYAYNLTRVKSAFDVGTMTLDDFEEFTEDATRDLAEYIIKNLNK